MIILKLPWDTFLRFCLVFLNLLLCSWSLEGYQVTISMATIYLPSAFSVKDRHWSKLSTSVKLKDQIADCKIERDPTNIHYTLQRSGVAKAKQQRTQLATSGPSAHWVWFPARVMLEVCFNLQPYCLTSRTVDIKNNQSINH